jgi:hypothetical protein
MHYYLSKKKNTGNSTKKGEVFGEATVEVHPREVLGELLVDGEADEAGVATLAFEPKSMAQSDTEEDDEVRCTSLEAEELDPLDISSLSLVRVDLAVGVLVVVEDVVDGVESSRMALDLMYSPPIDNGKVLVSAELDEDLQSPLVCTPLAILDPLDTKGSKRSKWVNRQYRGICKLMGFPIDSHEQQCLDLLRRIEATRATKKCEMGSQKVIPSGSKGV